MNAPLSPATTPIEPAAEHPSFRTALAAWLEIGLLSFGGPAAQIAVMHRVIVERHRWLNDEAFFRGLNFCLLLPGPEAHQLVTWLGYRLHGWKGGLTAGLLFILPGAALMQLLALTYAASQQTPALAAWMFGLRAAVVVLVGQALVRMGRKLLTRPALVLLAVAGFLAMLSGVPYPVVMLTAALVGIALPAPASATTTPSSPVSETVASPAGWSASRFAFRFVGVLVFGMFLWWLPVALLALWLGPEHQLVQMGLFFGKLAVVSFGGAYAVLSGLQQAAVADLGWLTTTQMADGLGLAETTPGPLILVTQFVGTIAAWNQPAPFSPIVAGLLGGGVTLWATFTPSFLWIFLAGPAINRIRPGSWSARALAGISAAVVGVIAVLALTLARETFFPRSSAALGAFPGDLFSPGTIGLVPVAWGRAFDLGALLVAGLTGAILARFPNRLFVALAVAVLIGAIVVGLGRSG
jgi:chromate transporter